jgi:hypothetical protein
VQQTTPAPPLQDQQQQPPPRGVLCQQPLQHLQSTSVRCRRSRQHSMVCSTSSPSVAFSGASSSSWTLSSSLQTTPLRGRSCSTGRLHTCCCSPRGFCVTLWVHCRQEGFASSAAFLPMSLLGEVLL